jgi:hypothetical protein
MARGKTVLFGLVAALGLFAGPVGPAAASGSHHNHHTKSSSHHHSSHQSSSHQSSSHHSSSHRHRKTTTPPDSGAMSPDSSATPPDVDATPPDSSATLPNSSATLSESAATHPEDSAAPPADPLESNEETPWGKGVPIPEREAARALVREGNRLIEESLFLGAANKYREALKHWDHPAIHFNLALALINLDQPIEVYQHLEQAMQYGDGPLGPDKLENAKKYKALVEGQLARVSIECEVRGARVTMDGKELFIAPGRHERLVRAGIHTIVASQEGFVPTERTENLPAGKTTALKLTLYTNEELTRYRRKWPAWKPWMAVVAGVVVGGAGGVLHWQAARNFAAYDQGIIDCSGCVPSSEVITLRTRAEALRTLTIVSYAVGGAGVTTGIVLLGVNRRRAYRINPSDDQPAPSPSLSFAPLLGPGQAGLVTTLRF